MLKEFRFMLIGITCLCFSSCLEINEEVEIKEDGSGQLAYSMDLAGLVDMLQAMGGEEFEKQKDEKIDTMISLKESVDEDSEMTPEQKELIRNGTLHVKMHMAEKEFRINMKYPFTSVSNLEKLSNVLSQHGAGLSKSMSNAMGKGEEEDEQGGEMDELMKVFEYSINNGKIKKTVNREVLQKLKDDPRMKEMQEAGGMGIEVSYTVSYKLPKPAKNVSNSVAELSADKKTVKLKGNLMEIFESPEKFELTIDY